MGKGFNHFIMASDKKIKRPMIIKILTESSFWASLACGGVVSGGMYAFLGRYKNLFLDHQSLQISTALIFSGFLLLSFGMAYLAIKRAERRHKTISAQWIMHGKRYEDIQYKALLNAISDVIFEVDEDGKLVFFNYNFTKLTGIPVEDVLNKPVFDLFHPAHRQENIQRFNKFIKKQMKPFKVKLNMETHDRSYRTVEVGFRIISESEEGRAHAIGTIVDREEEIDDKAAAKKAEQKYRDIFENAISGIFQTTPGGKFLSVNPALARILGYEGIQDVMNSVHSLAAQVYVRPEDRTKFKSIMNSQGRVEGFETQMYKKDGTKIWVVENARAVAGKDGEIEYYEGSLWDITDRKKTEEELKDAKVVAEMNSRTKTEFLANMSHELRTPLNAIIGFSEILKDEIMGPMGNDSYKEYASDIYNSGNALLKIISEILEVSKIEAGNRELNEGPVKLSRAVAACLVILKGKIEDHNLNVDIDVPEELPELIGEELVIKQILLNLISNAVKFTPANGSIQVKAYLQKPNGYLTVDVIDSGIGMNEEELAKATQPFWQANSSLARDISGTGLGLTLVRSLAGLHGAKLTLDSQPEKGTTARIVFPKERIVQYATQQGAEQKAPQSA